MQDRRLGRDGAHRRLEVRGPDGDATWPVIWFHGGDRELPEGEIDLAYRLQINDYRGQRSLQLLYEESRPAQGIPILVTAEEDTPPIPTVHDLRGQSVPAVELPSRDRASWYAEGTRLDRDEVGYAPRLDLPAQDKRRPLVLWSIPPSAQLLEWLVETTQPTEIFLTARWTSDDSQQGILKDVARMCRAALAQDGRMELARMAARLGTTRGVVRHSLLCLEVGGQITLEEWPDRDIVRIGRGSQALRGDPGPLLAALEEQLAEVRAFRRYYQRATPGELGMA